MTSPEEPRADLVQTDSSARNEVALVQGVLDETDARLEDIKRLAEAVEEARRQAEEAQRAAQRAKEKSAGLGKKKAAIEALQEAGVAASEALDALAESQRSLFENQQALATYIRELTAYALGSVANTRIVYQHLKEQLSGASEGELTELAQRELQSVMQEFKRQLDLVKRQEDTDRKLAQLRSEISRQKELAEQALADAQDQFGHLRQVAALAESNAARLDAVLEKLELQRQADLGFDRSLQVVNRRLDALELVSASTASELATEGVHGQQRDESIYQLFALASTNQDAARRGGLALEEATRSSGEVMNGLGRQLRVALGLSVAALILGIAATVVLLVS